MCQKSLFLREKSLYIIKINKRNVDNIIIETEFYFLVKEDKPMIRTTTYTQALNYYNQSNVKKSENAKDKTVQDAKKTENVKSSEAKLSKKAKDYLEKLRKEYSDYDFIVANAGDNHKGLVKQSTKEFSVIFTSAELERMADDEKYAQENISKMETAVKMSLKICEQEGFVRAFDDVQAGDTIVNKLAIVFNEDGSTSIFAELEKVSEKQLERIEKLKEKRKEEKLAAEKAEEKKAEEKKDNLSVKKVIVEAASEEELLQKIQELDWNKILEEKQTEGTRIDFSI